MDDDFVRVSVMGHGRPLLLIMGLGGNVEMWDPLERALIRRGFQTISYDASGTGASPTRLMPRRMRGLARQAAGLLDALELDGVDVLGVSFGGAVAQELARAHAQRLHHLVLASTMCGIGGVPGRPLSLALLATPLRYYSPAFLRTTATAMYGPTGDVDAVRDARARRPPSLWGYAGQLAAISGWSSLPWLHRVTTPTLVLSGSADPIVPPINARILAGRLPRATLEIVPAAGHLLVFDHAEHCARTIAAFIAEA